MTSVWVDSAALGLELLAHGVGERSDLPLPATALAIGGAAAVVISAIALMATWGKADFAEHAQGTRVARVDGPVGRLLLASVRTVGVVLFAVTVIAAFTVADNSAENISIRMVYVFYWVAIPLLSVIYGDWYRLLSPFEALASIVDRVRPSHMAREEADAPGGLRPMWGVAGGLLLFLWFELAFYEGNSARSLGWLLMAYAVSMTVGVVRGGRTWLRLYDPLGVWISLGAAISPIHVEGGELRIRPPLVGLAKVAARPGLAATVLVVLAGTSFDGVTRTTFWKDLVGFRTGWSATMVNTIGLLFTIAAATVLYLAAIRVMRRVSQTTRSDLEDQLAISLIPVAIGYAVAHYFSLLVFEGHFLLIQASDPFGNGSDFFRTRLGRVNYRSIGATGIARAQAIGIIGGHLAGVVAGHERAVTVLPKERSIYAQFALIAVMAVFAMLGLLLMVNV
jgi:hypothetical protein